MNRLEQTVAGWDRLKQEERAGEGMQSCMGPQEVAEIVRRSQVMEKALRDVMTTGAGATAVTGYTIDPGTGYILVMMKRSLQNLWAVVSQEFVLSC